MSKLKQSLAISSAAALVAAGFAVTTPAYAAGEVSLDPTAGTNLSVFNTDEFSLTPTVLTQVVSDSTFAYAITAPDGGKFYVKVGSVVPGNTATTLDDSLTFSAKDSLGNNIDLDSGTGGVQTTASLSLINDGTNAGFNDADTDELFGVFSVDFTALGARTLYISGFAAAANYNEIKISPTEATLTAESGFPAGSLDVAGASGTVPANSDEFDYGDGAGKSVSVQAWIDLDSDIDDVEANYASEVKTINWLDPKGVAAIPRVEQYSSGGTLYLNSDTNGNQNLGASLQFATSGINLSQIDITKWGYQVTDGSGTNIKAQAAFNNEGAIRDGLLEQDDSSRYYFVIPVGANLDKTKTYKVVVDHNSATTVDFGSVAYALPTSTEEYHIEATMDQTTTNAAQTSDTDTTVEMRTGTKTFTWTAQIKTDDSTVAKTASVPVLAVVKASSVYANGVISVTGTSETISSKSGYAIVNGFTNSDGKWSISITHSTAVKSAAYTVSFYVVDSASDDTKAEWVATNEATGPINAVYTATYTDAAATTLTADNSVLSGANIKVTLTAKDTYGVATAVNGTKALSVELKSANGTSYDKDVAVAADGTATFEFANYLAAGASDVMTATLYTGTSSSPTNVTTAIITLYNAASVAALQVPATANATITYDDFIVGKSTTAAPAPNDNTLTITGTAVDANGAGIPGAPVEVSSAGLQFVQNGGTVYAKDKITVVANAAGVFVVDVWMQKTSSTGFKIDFASGGKTASTTVKSYLPAAGVDGNNLKFELVLPATIVKNTTYAVTAKLTDKWGNPVATSTNNALSIQGFGSVQINSTDTATTRQFGSDGSVTVFVRSVKDIAGPGSIEAVLATNAQYKATSAGTLTNLTVTEITTDVTTTAWNETSFKNKILTSVEVLDQTPASAGEVAIGSFNGRVAVRVEGLQGQRLSVKVGKKWYVVASVPTNKYVWSVPSRKGTVVAVSAYINGDLENTSTITVK